MYFIKLNVHGQRYGGLGKHQYCHKSNIQYTRQTHGKYIASRTINLKCILKDANKMTKLNNLSFIQLPGIYILKHCEVTWFIYLYIFQWIKLNKNIIKKNKKIK